MKHVLVMILKKDGHNTTTALLCTTKTKRRITRALQRHAGPTIGREDMGCCGACAAACSRAAAKKAAAGFNRAGSSRSSACIATEMTGYLEKNILQRQMPNVCQRNSLAGSLVERRNNNMNAAAKSLCGLNLPANAH